HQVEWAEFAQATPELVGPCLGQPFAALTGNRRAVIAGATRLQRREDLVQRVLADALLALRRDLKSLRRALDLARLLEHLLEVGDAELLVEEAVLLAEVLHPAQRLVH